MFKKLIAATLLVSNSAFARRLETVDVLNDLLDGYVLTINEEDIPLEGIDVEGPMVCTNIEIGEIGLASGNTGSEVIDGVTYQYQTQGLEVFDLLLECELAVTVIGINIDIFIESTGSNVFLAWDFFSTDFARLIPTLARVDDDLSCDNAEDILDLDIDSDTSGGFIIDGIVAGELASLPEDLCPMVYELAVNISKIIGDNVLLEYAGFRPPATADIVASVVANEASLEALAPEGFEYYSEETFNAFLDALLTKFTDTAFGDTLYTAFTNLIAAWEAEDLVTVQAEVEVILSAFFGSEVTVSSTLVATVFSEVNDIIAIIEDISNEVTTIQTGVPLIIDDVFDIADAIFSETPTVGITVEEVIDALGEASWFTDFLETFGNETDIGAVITEFWTVTTIGDLLEYIPEDSIVVGFLTGLGTETTISAAVAELVETIKGLFGDFIGEGGIDLTIEDPLTESMISLLNIIASFVPEAQEVIAEIIAANNLTPLAEMFVFNVGLSDFGNITVGLYSLALDIDIEIVDTDSGVAGVSSWISPGIDVDDLSLGVGITLGLLNAEGDSIASDVITIEVDLAVFAQLGLTFALKLTSFDNFGFAEATDLITAVPVALDFAECAIASTALALSGQKILSDMSASLESENGEYSGLIEDLGNLVLELYSPAIPTVLEVFGAVFVPSAEFFAFPELADACDRHPIE